MKFLLTSGGVANASVRNALVELLGKPIEGSGALCIPTAEYGHLRCTPASAWRTWITRSCPRTRWPTRRNGPPRSSG
jgi:dipeptidase E